MALTQFFIMSMGFLDTAMAGHYSASDLAGVALGGNIMWPVFMLLSGVTLALTPIAAQLRGAGRESEIGAKLHQGIWIGAIGAAKAELVEALSRRQDLAQTIDWNDHPDTPPTEPFTKEAIQAIKAGKAVPVWSAVLEEWLWFVRDEKAKAKLVTEGCQAPIYTLGELAVVADMRLNSSFGSEDLKRVHAIKKKFGAAIEWPPKEAG